MKFKFFFILFLSIFIFSCSHESEDVKADFDFNLNTDKTYGEFVGEFAGLELGMWTSFKFKNGNGDTISILAFNEEYYKKLINEEGRNYLESHKDNSILDSILVKHELFLGKLYRVNWVTVFFNPDLEEAPSQGPLNSVFAVTRLNNSETSKSENSSETKQPNESVELSDGLLKINYQGNILIVHKPHSVTNFCTAKFENLRLGGYSDWRLPTPEELKVIYKHRDLLGLNTNSNMDAYDVSELLFGNRSAPVNEVWSSDYSEDKVSSNEEEYKHHYGGGGAYYNSRSEKTYYNVTTLNIITGEIKKQNSYRCGHGGDRAILIPVRDAD